MPIYVYKCDSCGFAKDVLQKISDAPLTQCPSCGVAAFKKQLTTAGFQLKGSGWYATDFKDASSAGASAASKPTDSADKPASATASPAATTTASTGSTGACGASCTCH